MRNVRNVIGMVGLLLTIIAIFIGLIIADARNDSSTSEAVAGYSTPGNCPTSLSTSRTDSGLSQPSPNSAESEGYSGSELQECISGLVAGGMSRSQAETICKSPEGKSTMEHGRQLLGQ